MTMKSVCCKVTFYVVRAGAYIPFDLRVLTILYLLRIHVVYAVGQRHSAEHTPSNSHVVCMYKALRAVLFLEELRQHSGKA
jgi:hypothetical protein